MAQSVILYIAATSNGKIADINGGIEWLEKIPNPEGSDFGYNEFYKRIGATIMGSRTYKQIKGWDIPFPYPDKKNYVFSHQAKNIADPNIKWVEENHRNFVLTLKENAESPIWLIGGGEINGWMLTEGLIDEIQLFIMPYILGKGIDLFGRYSAEKELITESKETYANGVIRITYKVNNDK
jgi:dihydrofolate reductase